MAIIVEGFDNSGKSTLAASFGLEIVHPGPRPKNAVEESDCFHAQYAQAAKPVVLDRVTCISTPCYTGRASQKYAHWLQKMLETPHCVLIYCRPPLRLIKDFSGHRAKGYDTPEKIKWLQNNCDEIVGRYDRWMGMVPHLTYDYTGHDLDLDLIKQSQYNFGAWKTCHQTAQRLSISSQL